MCIQLGNILINLDILKDIEENQQSAKRRTFRRVIAIAELF